MRCIGRLRGCFGRMMGVRFVVLGRGLVIRVEFYLCGEGAGECDKRKR